MVKHKLTDGVQKEVHEKKKAMIKRKDIGDVSVLSSTKKTISCTNATCNIL